MTDKIDFDPYDPAIMGQGPDAWAELGRKCPVHKYEGRFDFYIANDPDAVKRNILTDPATWTIEQGSSPKLLPEEQRTGLMTDDARHNKIRFIIQRGFSTPELKRLAVIVEQLADELIDQMLALPQQEGDFFDLFVRPLPARLMCLMLGVPEDQAQFYKDWADRYFYSIYNEPHTEMSVDEIHAVTGPLFELLKARRAHLADQGLAADLSLMGNVLPQDFLSRFMSDKIDGEYLEDGEILSLMLGIIVGGNETTMNLIGNVLLRLLVDRERWERLRADPGLCEVAVEESLRIDPPILGNFRCPRTDVALNGTVIPKDAKIMYNIASANRDPAIWPEPDSYSLDRPIGALRKNASFAGGNHSCVGAPLARMEVRVVLEKLLARMPKLRLDGTPERAAGVNVYGWVKLPMRWD